MDDTISYGDGWKTYYTKLPNEVFDDNCTLSPSVLTVYAFLLRCLNVKENGARVWPSYQTIAKCTRMTRPSAITCIKVLVGKRYILKKPHFVNGSQTSNDYLVNHPTASLDWLDPAKSKLFDELMKAKKKKSTDKNEDYWDL